MTSATLPTLDLSRLQKGADEAAAFRRDLREATHEYGFFYLTGHGVPDELFDGIIGTAREFFELPEADKLEIENIKSRHFRGYTRIGGERTQGKVDWREQIDIGPERAVVKKGEGVAPYWTLEGPNMWPSALPKLRDIVADWQANMDQVAITLMRAWAESLGADPDTYDAAFAKDPSTLIKIVRYPGRDEPTPQQGVGAHKDFGVLTLLYVEEGKGGLQVEKDGDWIDAPPIPYTFVVNIGELLEVATGGYLRATVHRVISPAAGQDRISVPYFYAPALDATIPTIELPADLAAKARGVGSDPHGQPLYSTYGENALKSRLRAHPDVAAIHHPELVKSTTAES